MKYQVVVDGETNLAPANFFATPGHASATAFECADETRRYIEEHGLGKFLREWELEQDLVVEVAGIRVHP